MEVEERKVISNFGTISLILGVILGFIASTTEISIAINGCVGGIVLAEVSAVFSLFPTTMGCSFELFSLIQKVLIGILLFMVLLCVVASIL